MPKWPRQVQPQVEQAQPQQLLPENFPEDNKENLADRFLCFRCRRNAVNIALIPCSHLLCSSCYNILEEPKKCPRCNIDITSTTRMFYGGYKQKYLKYKNKYLKLKNYKS